MILVIFSFVIALLLLLLDRGKKRAPGARSPLKAAAATLFLPGLGQLYNGDVRKALVVWLSGVAVLLVLTAAKLIYTFGGFVCALVVGLALLVGALVDAIRTARARQDYELQGFNRWYAYVGVVVLVVLAEGPVENAIGMRAFRIPSEGMSPNLMVGDFVMGRLVSPESYEAERGDVVVFRYPGDNRTMYIKRVVALPGEVFEIRNGELLVNGRPVGATWGVAIEDPRLGGVRDFGPLTVPTGTLFVVGDNLLNSADSRSWGPLPRENIVGVAEFVYFSWGRETNGIRFDRIGMNVE